MLEHPPCIRPWIAIAATLICDIEPKNRASGIANRGVELHANAFREDDIVRE